VGKKEESLAEKCFKIGEQAGIDLLNTLMTKIKKEHSKSNHLVGLGALLSGITSCLLYQGHRELERMLLERKEELGEADQWLQTTITKVLEAFDKDHVPVEARFFIGRAK
jgi:hypothetical protein